MNLLTFPISIDFLNLQSSTSDNFWSMIFPRCFTDLCHLISLPFNLITQLNTVRTFKYLGSIFDSNGGAERDINNRDKLAWMKWKQLTGVICDKKVPIKLKDKVYKTVIKPTMTYGAECWPVRKKDENRLHVAEMRMVRWIRGKTRKDHVRNKIIQEYAKVCQMSTFLRQKRLHWYGHVKRREEDNLSRKMMDVVVPGKRRRGRPRLRWTDNNREDMTTYELTADMTEN